MIEIAKFICSMVMVVGFLGGLAIAGSADHCERKWKNSGMESSYGMSNGCTVKLPSGEWVPDSAVRFTVKEPDRG